MILYSYWRSTTAYRVRAALNLKGIAFETRPINLYANAQTDPDYRTLNPSAGVPALQLPDGTILTQSLAIIDYLDAIQPSPALLPSDPLLRARVLAVTLSVATDIHPANNLRVMTQLESRFGASPDDKKAWMQHWMAEGFAAIEALLPGRDTFASTSKPTSFAFGETLTIADLTITAQAYNAHRWDLSLTPFPRIARIEAACLAIPQIAAAAPEAQPDAPHSGVTSP